MIPAPATVSRQTVLPCDCAAHPFPHRRDNWCRIEEDGNDRDDVRELRDADNAERAADCRAESRVGVWA